MEEMSHLDTNQSILGVRVDVLPLAVRSEHITNNQMTPRKECRDPSI
jgi:hypothetical protein